MINSKFKITHRFFSFIENFEINKLKDIQVIAIATGWLLTAIFFLQSLNDDTGWILLWIIINGYFWIHLNRFLLQSIKPMMELLLAILFVLATLDVLLINLAIGQFDNLLMIVLHTLLLSFIVLLLGLILIINSQKTVDIDHAKTKIKQGVLFRYGLIGYLGHLVVFYDHIYFLYVFLFVLFVSLLKKTQWLEVLSKFELWLYLVIFLILFFLLPDSTVFNEIKNLQNINNSLWLSVPYYLYLLFKIYLLVLVVKIPVVMIYNHAALSRKLYISGLFQSTLPQLIQFIVLIFGFYFFISSWQADQLRSVLNSAIENMYDNNKSKEITYYQFNEKQLDSPILIKGYNPITINSNQNNIGIVNIVKTNDADTTKNLDFFLYVNPKDSLNNHFYLLHIDSSFMNMLTHNLSVVVRTGLIAYPYTLKSWQKAIYDFDFWQQSEMIKIFPFCLLTSNTGFAIKTEVWSTDDPSQSAKISSHIYFSSTVKNLVLGRLYFPVLNQIQHENSFFAIDIYFLPDNDFFTSFIARILYVLIFLSFLFNLFITQRVIKFGNEIHHMIVQKFNQLKTGIREISSGNLDYKVRLEGEDEFVEFANRFNQMGEKLQKTINDLREKDRLDHELQIARNVQLSLIPAKLPDIPGFSIAASIETATEVGGDFYDIFELEKNKYLFTIGDVSGKGSSAAFYMAQFISLLRYSVQFTKKPEEIALRLNDYFTTHVSDRQIFVTAIIGVIDISASQILLVRAGHNLPVLIPADENKKIVQIDSSGIGFGLTKKDFKKSLKVEHIPFENGNKMLLYTDGIIEAARPDGQQMLVWGEENLLKQINFSKKLSASKLLETIIRELKSFYGGYPLIDDCTLLILEKNT